MRGNASPASRNQSCAICERRPPRQQYSSGVGVRRDERCATSSIARVATGAGNEFFAERDRGLLAAVFVARADRGAFGVGQQRQIDGVWKCA